MKLFIATIPQENEILQVLWDSLHVLRILKNCAGFTKVFYRIFEDFFKDFRGFLRIFGDFEGFLRDFFTILKGSLRDLFGFLGFFKDFRGFLRDF